ncbi:hypothetical protein [Kitasatospora sp. NPDC094015]|uniref:hypothetical protein n=1 Tax=Kitasatospora sp. NPDC094015 TaxID=3155205 RepID=UPI00332BA1F8
MDAEMSALAGVAAAALVQQVTTSAWERVRLAVGDLWRRRHPERAETVLAELDEAREEAAQARRAGDADTEQLIVDEWRTRLRRLLAADPGASTQLRSLLEELTGTSAPAGPGSSVTMTAHASGRARINQSAGDMHVTER